MITREDAEHLVLVRLNSAAPASRRAAIGEVWAKPYGWVVLYDSEAFLRDGNTLARFLGNGPVVVMHDGSMHVLGSAEEAQGEVAAFERERGLAGE